MNQPAKLQFMEWPQANNLPDLKKVRAGNNPVRDQGN
jgi:hypothetical protein